MLRKIDLLMIIIFGWDHMVVKIGNTFLLLPKMMPDTDPADHSPRSILDLLP